MKLTTKAKLLIQKSVPEKTFLNILSFYRGVSKYKPYTLKELRVLSFKNKVTKNLSYKNIDYKLILDPSNGQLDQNVFLNGPYEKEILDQFINVVKKGDIILDVGANIGHHSVFLAKLTGENGKVIAFEPIEKLALQIEESAKINSLNNLQTFHAALGENKSETVIYINSSVIGSSSILETRYGNDVEQVNIKVEKLDDIFKSLNISRVDFMKIDVEGYEWFVLQGGSETVAKFKPNIVIEYSPEYYRQNDVTHMDKIIDFLRKNNYKIFDIENNNKEIVDDTEFKNSFSLNLRSQTNLLCKAK